MVNLGELTVIFSITDNDILQICLVYFLKYVFSLKLKYLIEKCRKREKAFQNYLKIGMLNSFLSFIRDIDTLLVYFL